MRNKYRSPLRCRGLGIVVKWRWRKRYVNSMLYARLGGSSCKFHEQQLPCHPIFPDTWRALWQLPKPDLPFESKVGSTSWISAFKVITAPGQAHRSASCTSKLAFKDSILDSVGLWAFILQVVVAYVLLNCCKQC